MKIKMRKEFLKEKHYQGQEMYWEKKIDSKGGQNFDREKGKQGGILIRKGSNRAVFDREKGKQGGIFVEKRHQGSLPRWYAL